MADCAAPNTTIRDSRFPLRLMRPAGRRAALAILLLAAAACGGAPELELADGSATSWQELQGQWLVINYWAEWCAPCRKEIPELNELHAHGADAGVMVLGVNFDGLRGESLTTLMAEMGVEFPVLVEDPGQRWDQPPPSVLPSTLVIDPHGKLHDVLVGPQTYEDLARAVELSSEV
ncbi:MAG: TlpA disulfide reductase family protein [Gammaproteobacteria bacterium]|nr:TlpA disulfide reductase family protein [Gammaproteobacteria bacterium]